VPPKALPPKRKVPPFGGTFLALSLGLMSDLTSAFALLIGVLLARFFALTVRILLPLLSGLLAATLLLAGLLTRVLVLLARVLILAGHSGSPFLT